MDSSSGTANRRGRVNTRDEKKSDDQVAQMAEVTIEGLLQAIKALESKGITVQDPSALTVARIDHEIGALRELLSAKDGANDARLAAMDKAVALLEKFPTAIDVAVGNLKELHQEKFEGVGVRFNELNTRLTEGDRYKQTALDAALKAAQTLVDKQQENNKESIKKTEDLFTKQIEAITAIVNDLKDSVKESAGRSGGADETWKTAAIFIAIAISLATVIVQILERAH